MEEMKGNEGRKVIAKSRAKGDNWKLCFAFYPKQSDRSNNNGQRRKKTRPIKSNATGTSPKVLVSLYTKLISFVWK
jgi:hypothetical protein